MQTAKPMDLLVDEGHKITRTISCKAGNYMLFEVFPDGHTLVASGDDGIVRVRNLGAAKKQ